ncbi:hypothetical protein BT96DRAFT_1023723 [Gymnopus androsaceus JB14]|uniref:G-protein coupled receptors family 1 profile domain-containing protein n=1 Tax=Gymnopus androsaceus JB14 TaxID=1447944 RepID=A0A6A4H2B3_9AGAR|nr:hypothetical protein BT96DRAFT_1023723 [Gymnopus androsaceus JB14]
MTASQLPTSHLVYDTNSAFAKVFIGLQLSGLIGNLVVLAIAYFSPVSRHISWFSFIILWILYSLGFLILFFSGHYHDEPPPFGLCMFQSAIIHTSAPSATAGTLALVFQLYVSVHSAVSSHAIPYQGLWLKIILILPYAVGAALVAMSLILGLVISSNTTFNVVEYCAVNQRIPGRVTAGLSIAFIIPVLIINCMIYLILRKHWSEFRASHLRQSRSLFIRASVFSVCAFMALGAGLGFFLIVYTASSKEPFNEVVAKMQLAYDIMNMFLSLFPVMVMLVFGTHKDILLRLLFWKKAYSISESSVPNISLTITSTGDVTQVSEELRRGFHRHLQSRHCLRWLSLRCQKVRVAWNLILNTSKDNPLGSLHNSLIAILDSEI